MSAGTVHEDIRLAGRQALLAVEGLPGAVAWEGEPFEIPRAPWLRERMVTVQSMPVANGLELHRCLLVYTPHWPSEDGPAAVERFAGTLRAAFPPGRALIHDDTKATVFRAERGDLDVRPDFISLPVRVTVQAYIRA